MYKIYVNECLICLCRPDALAADQANDPSALIIQYRGVKRVFFNALDTAEKSSSYRKIYVVSEELSTTWNAFRSLFVHVPAAGGIVRNPNGKILMIYRRKHWDLPKGKKDEGESKKAAALREVCEETGATDLILDSKFGVTYHVYRDKQGRRLLKDTHWYLMTSPKQALTPQAEEGIKAVRWKTLSKFLAYGPITYRSISDLLWAYYESISVSNS